MYILANFLLDMRRIGQNSTSGQIYNPKFEIPTTHRPSLPAGVGPRPLLRGSAPGLHWGPSQTPRSNSPKASHFPQPGGE